MNINVIKIIILFIVLINFILIPTASFASVSETKDSPKYILSEDDNFNKIFREGRDLIDKEEWKLAAAKFNEITCDCPEKTQVDAAFYWLAFCYKKQNMFKEMDKTIDRLLKSFPNSSWADDARVMKYDRPAIATTTSRPGVNKYPSQQLYEALTKQYDAAAATLYSTTSQTPLEREDEIKLAAFQSLLYADPKRAIEVLGDLLRTDSKVSETLKRQLIRTLRTPRLSAAQSYGNFSTYAAVGSKAYTQYLPQLRETLVKSYQNESNIKVRTEIIYALANLNDDESNNYIVQLYVSEQNKELKKAIINSLSGTSFYPIALAANANLLKKGNFDKLLEIVRTEKDVELRGLALSNLRKFSGWSAKEGVIATLSQMYDSESDEEFKLTIIRSFALAKENQATTKLLDIAKNDKSDKMRLEAIHSLRTSTNPEVSKFLEDLIK